MQNNGTLDQSQATELEGKGLAMSPCSGKIGIKTRKHIPVSFKFAISISYYRAVVY
jgi:hypothetical protein